MVYSISFATNYYIYKTDTKTKTGQTYSNKRSDGATKRTLASVASPCRRVG